jgi:K+-sensing histidine kinase KdpD
VISPDVGTGDRSLGTIGWSTAVVGPLAVSAGLLLFRSELFAVNAALVLVLPVLGAAVAGGRRGGFLAAVTAALCFDFFFTRPYYSFTINDRNDVETMVVLLAVGLIVGEIVVRSRRSRREATARQREVDQIRRVAELAAGSSPASRLVDIVERELVELLGARGARFERPPYRTTLPRLAHGAVHIPGDAEAAGRPFGPRTELELPVWGGAREVGRMVLVLARPSDGVEIPSDDRALAVALADQLGAVLAAAAYRT